MLIREPVVEFRSVLAAMAIGVSLTSGWGVANADTRFRLEKGPQGQIRPFKAVSVPLSEFVREYSRLTSTRIMVGGSWEQELKGSVTLFLRRPFTPQVLTEMLFRVLSENGYAVVEAPAENGWVVMRTRDARDAALPVYEIGEVPDSGRYVTAYRDLRYVDAETVARMMRSFMPANSRIIPATPSQIFITDTASNIRKINEVISRLDTAEVAKRRKETPPSSEKPGSCGEHRIEKLVVEKLEIRNGGSGGSPFPPQVQVPRPIKAPKEGGKK